MPCAARGWLQHAIHYCSLTPTCQPAPACPLLCLQDVELVQFMGKDNVPFHTVIFPATLLGTQVRGGQCVRDCGADR